MSGPYRCILADPPWHKAAGGGGRGAQRHYKLMQPDAILRTMMQARWGQDGPPVFDVADRCHLWLWTIDAQLPDALCIMASLGFRYVRTMAWVKTTRRFSTGHTMSPQRVLRCGTGQYLRSAHEICLFGVRGTTHKPSSAPPSVILAPRGEHSAKPVEARETIERVSAGPRLEMFAREQTDGWDAWGNEVNNAQG